MIIKNDKICAGIDLHGAELTSLKRQDSDEELIWTADKDYWGRHAPMLFPIVGKVWNGQYRVGDKIYNLPQHGFARDLNFTALCQDTDSVVLALESNEDTLKVYPYKFRIEATYKLEDSTLVVEWRIKTSFATPLPSRKHMPDRYNPSALSLSAAFLNQLNASFSSLFTPLPSR